MRIVQLVPSLDEGELAQEALEFAVELARLGHDSAVISAGGALVSRLTLHNCQHFELPLNQRRWLNGRLHRKLRQQVQALDADILLCRGAQCAWHGAQVWKRLPAGSRPRLVTSVHQWPTTGLFRKRRANAALAQGELVLSASDELAQQFSQRHSDTAKLRTLYRGVNTRELDKNAKVSGHWHHRLLNDFPQLEERNWLLLPGPIGPGRGQEQFLELLAVLKQQRQDIFGLIVGEIMPGHEKFARTLERRAETMGLSEYVLFLGPRRDMRELYASARITFDLTGDPGAGQRSSGRVVAESLAMGCPAVATGGTGIELLKRCFPQGVVTDAGTGSSVSRLEALASVAGDILQQSGPLDFSGFSLTETASQAVDWFNDLQTVSCE
ncbi:glycosyltransferase [Microbulbifer sp. YPW1]|uniref:glycosyltransferase n=1 Tax=Microbulbifer sp. YPW1 TaxID=2745199 RepID=UPI001599214A|nr:glycosyltransferase [Microbulbifer sp. YPW1]QKX18634.1 glycosyltransferase [Microbulbifer sp. YPW1]